MRGKVIAAILGLVLAIGGLGLLGYGISRVSALPGGSYECYGEGCLDDPWFLAFPAGIIGIVFGLIIASWALSAIRDERVTGPLRVFGFMSGVGGIFFAMGVIFLSTSSGFARGDDGTFGFLGALFGLMGLAFIGVDMLRFRGELRKDRLRVSGLKGTARVVGVRDTNVTVNNSPMVNLDLEVTLPGQPSFRTSKRTVISRLSIGALTPGATIAVLADPAKPKDIVLDWEGTTPAPSAGSESPFSTAMSAFLPGGLGALGGLSALRTFGGTNSADVLRGVSQALALAAERAEHAGTVTRTPDGTTVIDGGTTVMMNGQVVQPSDYGALMRGLPAAIAAAMANAGLSGTGPAGAGPAVPGAAVPALISGASPTAEGGSVPAVPSIPDAPTVPAPAASTALNADIPVPGATAGSDGLPARVGLDTIQDTGVDIAGNRLYTFDLTISPAASPTRPNTPPLSRPPRSPGSGRVRHSRRRSIQRSPARSTSTGIADCRTARGVEVGTFDGSGRVGSTEPGSGGREG